MDQSVLLSALFHFFSVLRWLSFSSVSRAFDSVCSDIEIDHGGLDAFMSQQMRYLGQVHSVLEPVGGPGMPQLVRMKSQRYFLGLESCLDCTSLKHLVKVTCRYGGMYSLWSGSKRHTHHCHLLRDDRTKCIVPEYAAGFAVSGIVRIFLPLPVTVIYGFVERRFTFPILSVSSSLILRAQEYVVRIITRFLRPFADL